MCMPFCEKKWVTKKLTLFNDIGLRRAKVFVVTGGEGFAGIRRLGGVAGSHFPGVMMIIFAAVAQIEGGFDVSSAHLHLGLLLMVHKLLG